MEEITFITSDVKLMVTITDSTGVSQTIQMEFLTLFVLFIGYFCLKAQERKH